MITILNARLQISTYDKEKDVGKVKTRRREREQMRQKEKKKEREREVQLPWELFLRPLRQLSFASWIQKACTFDKPENDVNWLSVRL